MGLAELDRRKPGLIATFIHDESNFVVARMVRQKNMVRAPLLALVRRAALIQATVSARTAGAEAQADLATMPRLSLQDDVELWKENLDAEAA